MIIIETKNRLKRVAEILELITRDDPCYKSHNPHPMRLYIGMDYVVPESKISVFSGFHLKNLFDINNRYVTAPLSKCSEFVLMYITYNIQHKSYEIVCCFWENIDSEKIIASTIVQKADAIKFLITFDEYLYHIKYGKLCQV